MGTVTVLLSVLIVAATILCAVGVWAIFEGVKTARSVRVLSDDLDARIVPLLDKADVTVDAFNAELLRIDAIVTRFEDISDRVETTSRTVQDVASAPVEIVTDFAERIRRAWKGRSHSTPPGYGPQHEAEDGTESADVSTEFAPSAEPHADDVPTADSEENRSAHVQ